MKKNIWILLLTLLLVIVGGCSMGHETNNEQKRNLEMNIAKMIVHDYEAVETIEFLGWGFSRETGRWGTSVIINKDSRMSLSFDDLSGLDKMSAYRFNPATFKLEEKVNIDKIPPVIDKINEIEKINLDNIEIKYSDERGD